MTVLPLKKQFPGITFQFHRLGEITPEEFNVLYERSFKKKNDNLITPVDVVTIYDDGEYRGFLDISPMSNSMVYLRYIGFEPPFKPSTVKYIRASLAYIHSIGYSTIMGGIEARNRLTLMWALRENFYIYGYKYLGNGIEIVDVRRDVGVETSSYTRGFR